MNGRGHCLDQAAKRAPCKLLVGCVLPEVRIWRLLDLACSADCSITSGGHAA